MENEEIIRRILQDERHNKDIMKIEIFDVYTRITGIMQTDIWIYYHKNKNYTTRLKHGYEKESDLYKTRDERMEILLNNIT